MAYSSEPFHSRILFAQKSDKSVKVGVGVAAAAIRRQLRQIRQRRQLRQDQDKKQQPPIQDKLTFFREYKEIIVYLKLKIKLQADKQTACECFHSQNRLLCSVMIGTYQELHKQSACDQVN